MYTMGNYVGKSVLIWDEMWLFWESERGTEGGREGERMLQYQCTTGYKKKLWKYRTLQYGCWNIALKVYAEDNEKLDLSV